MSSHNHRTQMSGSAASSQVPPKKTQPAELLIRVIWGSDEGFQRFCLLKKTCDPYSTPEQALVTCTMRNEENSHVLYLRPMQLSTTKSGLPLLFLKNDRPSGVLVCDEASLQGILQRRLEKWLTPAVRYVTLNFEPSVESLESLKQYGVTPSVCTTRTQKSELLSLFTGEPFQKVEADIEEKTMDLAAALDLALKSIFSESNGRNSSDTPPAKDLSQSVSGQSSCR